MMAAITWNLDPVLADFGFYSLRYYTLCWFVAFVASYIVLRGIFRKEGIVEVKLMSLAIYVIVGTFIGARLGHCLFYDPAYFLAHPLEIILPVSRNAMGEWVITGYLGLASHGGAIGILVALLLYSRKNLVSIWDVADKLGLVAPLAGGFIRLGNFFNSEIYGNATDMPCGVVFSRVDDVARHPSQLYEAVAYFLIFALLYCLYTRRRGKHGEGFIFGVSITLIFVMRFFIEYTKEVQSAFELTMRQTVGMDMGQLLSLPFIIAGLIVIVVTYRDKEERAERREARKRRKAKNK